MTGWTGVYGPSPDLTVTRGNGAAHSGSCSLKVTGLTGAKNLASGFNDHPRWVQATVAGTTYTQSAWADPLTAATTGWQQLSQTLTTAGSGHQLSFAVYANSISAGQSFYADDFSLTTPD